MSNDFLNTNTNNSATNFTNNATNNVWKRSSGFSLSRPIVGLDFGTSNSCIAVWNPTENRAKVIRNSHGKKLTPSTVVFDTDNFVNARVGVDDEQEDLGLPVISGIKSLLGGRVVDGRLGCPKAINDSGKFAITCTNRLGEKNDIDVAEICSFILRDLIHTAEAYLLHHRLSILPTTVTASEKTDCYRVRQAVIGVPAHFTETMKNNLRRAAALAGLEEVAFLVESSAAALSYGLFVAGKKTVLVFDMGGGTTDVSLLRIAEGRHEVAAVDGHNACGGQDLDAALLHVVLEKLLIVCGYPTEAISRLTLRVQDHALLFAKLLAICRSCKERLSETEVDVVKIPHSLVVTLKRCCDEAGQEIFSRSSSRTKSEVPIEIVVTRDEFNKCVHQVVQMAMVVVRRAVQQYRQHTSSISPKDIDGIDDVDEVVLVGGSSRVPLVRQKLRDALGSLGLYRFASIENSGLNMEFCTSVDPDQAVVQGLAIRAAVLMGHEIPQLKDVLMMDRLCSSIGLLTWEDDVCQDGTMLTGCLDGGSAPARNSGNSKRYFEPILNCGDKLPAKGCKQFRVLNSEQKFVSLDIYEEIENEEDDLQRLADDISPNSFKYQLIEPDPRDGWWGHLDSMWKDLVGHAVTPLVHGVRIVTVTLSMNEDGALSFAVTDVVPTTNNVALGSNPRKSARVSHPVSSVGILLFYLIVLISAHFLAKVYFPKAFTNER